MKTHFITVDNAWPALQQRNMAGNIPSAEYFPVQAFASDLHYTLLPNGILTCLFQVAKPEGVHFERILESLPACSGLQLYSHHVPGAERGRYLALSSLVPYRCRFSPLNGFASILNGASMVREIEQLESSTRDTYETLVRAVLLDGGALELMGSPAPLLQALGPLKMNEAALAGQNAVSYNLSYLRLGPARLAMLVAFNAFPSAPKAGIPMPSGDTEYLSASCVHLPEDGDLARMDSEVEDYLTFLHYFRKAGMAPDAGFPDPGAFRGEPALTLKGRVLGKHYVLLFGETLAELRLRGHAYFRELCRVGVSFHATMIRTRENYAHLYPGCFRLLHDGVRLEAAHIPAVLRGLHP